MQTKRRDRFKLPTKREAEAVSEYYYIYRQTLRYCPAKVGTIFGMIGAAVCIAAIIAKVVLHSNDPSLLIIAAILVIITLFCTIHMLLCGRKYAPFIKGNFRMMYGYTEKVEIDICNTRYYFVLFKTQSGKVIKTWFHVPVKDVYEGSPLMLIQATRNNGSKGISRVLTPAMLKPYSQLRTKRIRK